jgi:hypothetical protein
MTSSQPNVAIQFRVQGTSSSRIAWTSEISALFEDTLEVSAPLQAILCPTWQVLFWSCSCWYEKHLSSRRDFSSERRIVSDLSFLKLPSVCNFSVHSTLSHTRVMDQIPVLWSCLSEMIMRLILWRVWRRETEGRERRWVAIRDTEFYGRKVKNYWLWRYPATDRSSLRWTEGLCICEPLSGRALMYISSRSRHYPDIYCDMTPESRSNEVRIDVHC